MPNAENRLYEWYFESGRKCLIPDKNKKQIITYLDSVDGQIITFSFHVQASDQIRCYFIWDGKQSININIIYIFIYYIKSYNLIYSIFSAR